MMFMYEYEACALYWERVITIVYNYNQQAANGSCITEDMDAYPPVRSQYRAHAPYMNTFVAGPEDSEGLELEGLQEESTTFTFT